MPLEIHASARKHYASHRLSDELVLLQFDDGREILIHAMKARKKYTDELRF